MAEMYRFAGMMFNLVNQEWRVQPEGAVLPAWVEMPKKADVEAFGHWLLDMVKWQEEQLAAASKPPHFQARTIGVKLVPAADRGERASYHISLGSTGLVAAVVMDRLYDWLTDLRKDGSKPELDRSCEWRRELAGYETQATVNAWQRATFGDGSMTPLKQYARLAKELSETLTMLANKTETQLEHAALAAELADLQVVLWGLADACKVDLRAATNAKMKVNRARAWAKAAEGDFQHV